MPPESTTARMSHTPCLILFVKICIPTQLDCLPVLQPVWPQMIGVALMPHNLLLSPVFLQC